MLGYEWQNSFKILDNKEQGIFLIFLNSIMKFKIKRLDVVDAVFHSGRA